MTDQLNAYLDYELPEAERDQVREHLRLCPTCENELATLRATKQLLADLPVARTPRSFALSVEQAEALKARPVSRTALAAPPRRLPGLVLGLRLAASAAFVLCLLLVGTDLLYRTASLASAPLASTFVTAQGSAQAPGGRAAVPNSTPAAALAPAAAPQPNATAAAGAAIDANAAKHAAESTPAPPANAAANVQPTTAAGALPPAPPPAAGAAGGAAADTFATPGGTGSTAGSAPAGPAATAPPPGLSDRFSTQSSAAATPPEPAFVPLIGSAAPPTPAPMQFLPWEVALAVLAVGLAAASIILPRRGR